MNKFSTFLNKVQMSSPYNDENFQLITSLEFYNNDMFTNQRIFIYNENSLKNEKLQNILLKLKADVIHSFDDKVNYVITSNKKVKDEINYFNEDSKHEKNNLKVNDTSSKPKVSYVGLSIRNRICSIAAESKNATNKFGLNQSANTRIDNQSGFLQKVKKLGIKVLSINDVWKWLLENYPVLIMEGETTEENHSLDVKKKIQAIKTPAIKIFDKQGRYKPEYKSQTNLNREMWEETSGCNTSKDEESGEKELEMKNDSCVSISKKSVQVSLTKGQNKSVKAPKVMNEGYCECCDSKFMDIKTHLESFQHQKFADDAANFVSIDEVLKDFVNFESFYKTRMMKQTVLERRASVRLIKQLSVNDFKNEQQVLEIKKNEIKIDGIVEKDSVAGLRSVKSENNKDILSNSVSKVKRKKLESLLESSQENSGTLRIMENGSVAKSMEIDLLKKFEVDLENQKKQLSHDWGKMRLKPISLTLKKCYFGKIEEIIFEEQCTEIESVPHQYPQSSLEWGPNFAQATISYQLYRACMEISSIEFQTVPLLEPVLFVQAKESLCPMTTGLIHADKVLSTQPLVYCSSLEIFQDLSEKCYSLVVADPIYLSSKTCSNNVFQAPVVTVGFPIKDPDSLSRITPMEDEFYFEKAFLSTVTLEHQHHLITTVQSSHQQEIHQSEVASQSDLLNDINEKDNESFFNERHSSLDDSIGSSIERLSLRNFRFLPDSIPDDIEVPLSPVVSNSRYYAFSPHILRSIDKKCEENDDNNFTPSYNYSPDRYKTHFTDFNYDFLTTSPSNSHVKDIILNNSDFNSPIEPKSNCNTSLSKISPNAIVPVPQAPSNQFDETDDDFIIDLRYFLNSSNIGSTNCAFNVLSNQKTPSQKIGHKLISIDSIVQNRFQDRFNVNLNSLREVTNHSKIDMKPPRRIGKNLKRTRQEIEADVSDYPINSSKRKKLDKNLTFPSPLPPPAPSPKVKRQSNITKKCGDELSPSIRQSRPFRQAKSIARQSIQIATDFFFN